MSVLTHCLPTGNLGTNEIPVCNISDYNVTASIPVGGLGVNKVRGVVAYCHGLSDGPQPIPATIGTVNASTPAFNNYLSAFRDNLVNDGWIFLAVPYPEDYYISVGSAGIWNDLNSDTGFGSRYLTNHLHWWDHVVQYIQSKWGASIPIVAHGTSWGGWTVLQIAKNRQSSIIAYEAHIPATLLSYVNQAFCGPVNFGPNSVTANGIVYPPLVGGTSGLDIGQHHLDSVTIPGMVSYGTNDEAVGWQTTASLPNVTPINSNIDAMLTNATPSGYVVRNQTSDYHEFTAKDAGFTTTFTPAGPTALSALSTLTIGDNTNLTSGQCAIFASDSKWHIISFSSKTGSTQLNSCTYSGTVSATVSAGANICLTGTSISGGYQNMAIPYWFGTVVDPLAPKNF
jgi:hypothetical protein